MAKANNDTKRVTKSPAAKAKAGAAPSAKSPAARAKAAAKSSTNSPATTAKAKPADGAMSSLFSKAQFTESSATADAKERLNQWKEDEKAHRAAEKEKQEAEPEKPADGAANTSGKTASKPKKSKKQIEKENEEQSQRTIFLGNVPVDVKAKSLKTWIAETACKAPPKAEKEDSKETTTDDSAATETAPSLTVSGIRDAIDTIRFRSVQFTKVALSGSNRKTSFIKKQFHDLRPACNAYVVFTAAAVAREVLDALMRVPTSERVFKDRHVFPDVVDTSSQVGNVKRTVFVGNLPFDADEEQIFQFFEACGEIERIRVVRDRVTNYGKGIAYVCFRTREAAGRAIEFNNIPFQLDSDTPDATRKPRPIRVSRCHMQKERASVYATKKESGQSGTLKKEASHYRQKQKDQNAGSKRHRGIDDFREYDLSMKLKRIRGDKKPEQNGGASASTAGGKSFMGVTTTAGSTPPAQLGKKQKNKGNKKAGKKQGSFKKGKK